MSIDSWLQIVNCLASTIFYVLFLISLIQHFSLSFLSGIPWFHPRLPGLWLRSNRSPGMLAHTRTQKRPLLSGLEHDKWPASLHRVHPLFARTAKAWSARTSESKHGLYRRFANLRKRSMRRGRPPWRHWRPFKYQFTGHRKRQTPITQNDKE